MEELLAVAVQKCNAGVILMQLSRLATHVQEDIREDSMRFSLFALK